MGALLYTSQLVAAQNTNVSGQLTRIIYAIHDHGVIKIDYDAYLCRYPQDYINGNSRNKFKFSSIYTDEILHDDLYWFGYPDIRTVNQTNHISELGFDNGFIIITNDGKLVITLDYIRIHDRYLDLVNRAFFQSFRSNFVDKFREYYHTEPGIWDLLIAMADLVYHFPYHLPENYMIIPNKGTIFTEGLYSPLRVLIEKKGDCDSKNLLFGVLFTLALQEFGLSEDYGLILAAQHKKREPGHAAFFLRGGDLEGSMPYFRVDTSKNRLTMHDPDHQWFVKGEFFSIWDVTGTYQPPTYWIPFNTMTDLKDFELVFLGGRTMSPKDRYQYFTWKWRK
jgi:hypothetical protein